MTTLVKGTFAGLLILAGAAAIITQAAWREDQQTDDLNSALLPVPGRSQHRVSMSALAHEEPFLRQGAARPRQAPAGASRVSNIWSFLPQRDSFRADALLDLRKLNEPIAGQSGFIGLSPDKNGFMRGDGVPVRFWAVNFTFRDFSLKDVAHAARFSESVPKALCCGPSPWSLVPKPILVLRPGQPTKHQLNHADQDLRLAGISRVFIILAVNPAPTQPAEGSLHHPPPRQQLKPSVPGKPADDLNHIPPVLRDPSVQGVIVVLGVRPQLSQARERFSRQLAEDLRCRRRIIHGRTGDGHG